MGLVSGQPSNLSRRYFGKAVGDASLTGLSPGWQVAGISIDNYSGSWLLVEPIHLLVPPYVLGWATPVSPANATIEITYVPGPGGFLGTTAGAPAVVTLTGYPVAPSPGVPFIASQQSPTLSVLPGFTNYGVPNKTLIAGVANQRLRIYSVLITPNVNGQGTSPIRWQLVLAFGAGTLLTQNVYFGVVGREPIPLLFPLGLDGPVGANLNGGLLELWLSGTGMGTIIAQPIITVYKTLI